MLYIFTPDIVKTVIAKVYHSSYYSVAFDLTTKWSSALIKGV